MSNLEHAENLIIQLQAENEDLSNMNRQLRSQISQLSKAPIHLETTSDEEEWEVEVPRAYSLDI